MRRYLDHAASSPLRPEAHRALVAALGLVGNPSSTHASGRAARAVLEDAREQLAAAVDCRPDEVVFTSGATEADNLAVLGAAASGPGRGRPLVAASRAEHPAVRDAVASLGERARWLAVDADGVVPSGELADLDDRTALVSVMAVNNETGALGDLAQVVHHARRVGALAHSDAAQALGHVAWSFAGSGLDAMSLSAHKVGGPVGVGALLLRRGVALDPVGYGGGQERRLRSGTVPVALAAGFAAAAEAAASAVGAESARLRGVRDTLVRRLAAMPGVVVNGGARVSPAICHATFGRCRADDLLLLLDAAGFDCSTGSACTAGVSRPSEVLLAAGRSPADAASSLRFSFGPGTTTADVEALADALPDAVARARAASGPHERT